MTVYVFRNGLVIPRGSAPGGEARPARSDLPAPMISRMEPFESPVTGKEISSWRERDRDMAAAGAVDPRDMPAPTRGRAPKKDGKHGRK
jgi:hypothetical protein